MVKQLEFRITMFMVGASVVGFMIGVRMDNRYPVDDMNVGKSYQTSQVCDKQRREYNPQIFPILLHHLVAKIGILREMHNRHKKVKSPVPVTYKKVKASP